MRAKMSELNLGDAEPQNPIEGVWVFPSYANLGAVETADGLVVIDLPIHFLFEKTWRRLRSVLEARVHTVFVTHGHGDHAFSLGPVFEEAEKNGRQRPNVIGHRNILNRYRRYRMLHGFHDHINRTQFAVPEDTPAFPLPQHAPDVFFDHSLSTRVGGLDFHARHALGETDDALWLWVPEKKTVFAGDLVIWSFPNIGNPLKVQRFTLEWAQALENIVGKEPEVLVPGHGPVIRGREPIRKVCLTVSSALRYLHDEVVDRLNRGQSYEEILHGVKPLKEWDQHDFLAPRYGHPTFVIHGILRQYSGWYDGNPSNLFPPPKTETQAELAELIGVQKLLGRIEVLKAAGNYPMALQLIDIAAAGAQGSDSLAKIRLVKASLLESLAAKEPSFIARNILLTGSSRESKAAGVE